METLPFLSEQHETSGRYAIFEDDGASAWLYITEPGTTQPVADAWVYNRVAAPTMEEVQSYRDQPPPAAQGFISDAARCDNPEQHEWSFLWSDDGEAVAILRDDLAMACILLDQSVSYSRNLVQTGPWGGEWNETAFASRFKAV